MVTIVCIICSEAFETYEYSNNISCPKCGQQYAYEEDIQIVLSEEQKIALRALKPKT